MPGAPAAEPFGWMRILPEALRRMPGVKAGACCRLHGRTG